MTLGRRGHVTANKPSPWHSVFKSLVFFVVSPTGFNSCLIPNGHKITSHRTLIVPRSPPFVPRPHMPSAGIRMRPPPPLQLKPVGISHLRPSITSFYLRFFFLFAVVSFLSTVPQPSPLSLTLPPSLSFPLFLNWLARLPRGKCHSGRACQV